MKFACIVLVTCAAVVARADCGAVVGADGLLTPGAHIVVGEIHGTNESPRVVGQLVCLAAKKGAVRLGVEFSSDEQPTIDRYLASAGTAADRKALMSPAKWVGGPQDGTHSAAMAELIESVRKLRQSGADAGIVAFSNAGKSSDRDLTMAENLVAAFGRAPKAIFVVITGNLHARKRGEDKGDERFMAMRIVERGAAVTALDSRYATGTTWACFVPTGGKMENARCEPAVIGSGKPAAPAVVLRPSGDKAYDGVLEVGAPTFSPPANAPLTAEQTAAIALVKRRLDGRLAYEASEFGKCGELYSTLGARDSEDAYNASCCFARAGKADKAFEQLTIAVDLGFTDKRVADADEDLASLRADGARWRKLAARLR